nr:S-layer homology domain-containing protein [Paenibacillus sp. SYP-B4298]
MNKLTLSWPSADVQGKVKQYRVYESGKTVPIRTLGNEARSVELTGLSSGTEYTFTVKAVDAAGSESAGLSQTVKTVAVTYPSGSTGSGSSGSSGSGNAGLAESVISPSAGGKLELGSELSVVVPAGASADDLRLTVEKLDSSAASAMVPSGQTLLSPVFEITKNSSDNFKKPITLSFQFDASAVPAGYKPSVFYYDEGKKEWVEMGGTVNGRIISVESDHLTPFAVLAVKAAAEPEQSGSAEPLFSDTAGHWAATDIGKAVKLGIAGGYPDGTFKPDKTVTRAEFAVLLMNALKREGAAAELVFKDRDAIGTWAGDAVAKAVQAGIINGYADQTFRPNAAVTRAEMVMMIAKSMGLKMDGKASTSFADDQEIPGWARGAVHAVQEQGWIQGRSGNQFAPQGTATRAEAIRVLLNMLETL